MIKHLFFLLILSLTGVKPMVSKAQKATISISNPFVGERSEEVVAIAWKDVLAKYPAIDTADFKVINVATKKEIPWQLEYKGGKAVQNILVQVDIAGNGTVKLLLQKGKSAIFPTKTYGRYVPERKEDFAWENDKIAFRMYGKELEQTPKEMAYGMDVWVKRTDKMIINERYKRGKYHEDLGDGMDYYHVGFTLGAGNVAPYVNDSIYHSKNYVLWKVLDMGILRTVFQLEYDEWDVNGMKVSATKTFSLDAGSQLNRVEALYKYSEKPTMSAVVGIIKRKDQGVMLLDEQQGIMGYWEPQMGEDGITGVGSIFLTPVTKMKITNEQLLAQTTTQKNEPLVYYTGAAWNKAHVFTTSAAWFNYLQTYKERLLKPLKVVIE